MGVCASLGEKKMMQVDIDVTMTSASIKIKPDFSLIWDLVLSFNFSSGRMKWWSSNILLFVIIPLFTQWKLAFTRSNFCIFLIDSAWLGRKLIVRGEQRRLTGQMISCCFSAWVWWQKSSITLRSSCKLAPPCSTHERRLRSRTFPASPEPPRSSARWLLTDFNYDSQELIWLLAVYPPSLPPMEANYAWVAMDERWTLLMALLLPLCSHYWGIWVVKWDHNWLLCHYWLCYKTLWARTQ